LTQNIQQLVVIAKPSLDCETQLLQGCSAHLWRLLVL